ERFALANHIEAGAIEKYGQKEGLPLALRMYQDMVVCDNEYGFYRNGVDNLLVEMGKWDLGLEDLLMVVNFFSKVTVDEDGR
ncbi:DUF1989 domain-containing protein, partial [Klebsiella michiganensis]|uniref:DUF1989 domain-containing protein n=1 Tax=Klebsiella michiganensis TaxID=1134687 RepID=UPI001D190236